MNIAWLRRIQYLWTMVTDGMWGSSDISEPGAPTAAIFPSLKSFHHFCRQKQEMQFDRQALNCLHISCCSMKMHEWHIRKKIYGWLTFCKIESDRKDEYKYMNNINWLCLLRSGELDNHLHLSKKVSSQKIQENMV